jgi:hypothetical protein
MTQQREAIPLGARPASGVAARPGLTTADPAVQIVESAHQILTMIGANPRAIRPILAQRRLTGEAVLAAATATTQRIDTVLTELDAVEETRRAAHETTVAEVQGFLAGGDATDQAGLEARLGDVQTAWSRFQKEQQTRRAYLGELRDRATRVAEVYQAV